jgi:hypothetical protein
MARDKVKQLMEEAVKSLEGKRKVGRKVVL